MGLKKYQSAFIHKCIEHDRTLLNPAAVITITECEVSKEGATPEGLRHLETAFDRKVPLYKLMPSEYVGPLLEAGKLRLFSHKYYRKIENAKIRDEKEGLNSTDVSGDIGKGDRILPGVDALYSRPDNFTSRHHVRMRGNTVRHELNEYIFCLSTNCPSQSDPDRWTCDHKDEALLALENPTIFRQILRECVSLKHGVRAVCNFPIPVEYEDDPDSNLERTAEFKARFFKDTFFSLDNEYRIVISALDLPKELIYLDIQDVRLKSVFRQIW